MTRLKLRPATETDIDVVVDLVTRAYRGPAGSAGWTTESHLLDGQRTDRHEVGEAIADPNGVLLLAEADGAITGCIRVDRDPAQPEAAHFGMFAVDPDRQSAGTGGFLLSAAEDLARREWGATSMALEVLHQRGDLQAWYQRRGYVATGDTVPFPYGDDRFGLPRRDDLVFDVLRRPLADRSTSMDRPG